mmetsp:Transcript_6737/g.20399  ORF Transcript_6737/g.20399 Transcript_6737/m.20399 type:complete len:118 (-) Transcript_6737:829-1182(-)
MGVTAADLSARACNTVSWIVKLSTTGQPVRNVARRASQALTVALSYLPVTQPGVLLLLLYPALYRPSLHGNRRFKMRKIEQVGQRKESHVCGAPAHTQRCRRCRITDEQVHRFESRR